MHRAAALAASCLSECTLQNDLLSHQNDPSHNMRGIRRTRSPSRRLAARDYAASLNSGHSVKHKYAQSVVFGHFHVSKPYWVCHLFEGTPF